MELTWGILSDVVTERKERKGTKLQLALDGHKKEKKGIFEEEVQETVARKEERKPASKQHQLINQSSDSTEVITLPNTHSPQRLTLSHPQPLPHLPCVLLLF